MPLLLLNIFQRTIIRLASLVISFAILFIILFNVLPYFADKTGWLWGILITYIISAYFIFPTTIRFKNIILRKKHIPAYTHTPDGLPLDPVNLIFVGSFEQLNNAFYKAGWCLADERNIKNLVRFVLCLIFIKPYPSAPFSPLFLFGRKQDFGFQKALGNSPRKRHHIRIWGVSAKNAQKLYKKEIWQKDHKPVRNISIWIGAATEDTGFGYRRDTYQITHSVKLNADLEREYIIKELKKSKVVSSVEDVKPGGDLSFLGEPVNHFVTDGKIKVMFLN